MSQRIPFRFAPIPDDMLFDPTMPAEVIVLWASIYRLTDRHGVAAIGQIALGKELGWSESTVRRHIRKAEERGVIGTVRRGKTLSNEYVAILRDQADLTGHDDGFDRSPRSGLTGHTSSSIETTTRDARTAAHAASFDAFWKLYPLKKDKGHARTAYAKALKTATATEIADGLDRCLPDLQKDPRFTPHAATWLNGERWTDEAPTPVAAKHWAEELAEQWA